MSGTVSSLHDFRGGIDYLGYDIASSGYWGGTNAVELLHQTVDVGADGRRIGFL